VVNSRIQPKPSFGIAVRDTGRFHEHLGFRLDADALGNRADGIYLLELEG
jgi:hypothetical protein